MAILSFYPAIPIYSGLVALDTTGYILNMPASSVRQSVFIPIFITTIITGMILSTLVFVLALLLSPFILQGSKDVKTVVDND